MIKTNLLPYRAARRKENIRRQLSVFVLFFIFIAMGLFYYRLHLSNKIDTLDDQLKAVKTELKGFQDQVKEVDEIKAKLSVLDQKLGVMDDLNKGREEPVVLLQKLVDLTVKNQMWITSMSEAGDQISLNGIAMDNKTVAMFMSRIEKDEFFSGVELKSLVLVNREGLKLKQFNLTCSKAA
ncbi:MAG: PilN domain-containing protein [Desulfosudaceae bacterium]